MLVGFVLGAVLGLIVYRFFPDVFWIQALTTYILQPIGQIFLRIIFSAVVPLVFSSIVLGVYEMGDFKALGRISIKTLLYTIFASVTSVLVGLALVAWLKPGAGFDSAALDGMIPLSQKDEIIANAGRAKPALQAIIELIPRNPLEAAVRALEGEMLALMVFALIFGAALLAVRGNRSGDPLVRMLESLRDVAMKIVDFAMVLRL
jgi:DAACS family dicarboxylate/amino acid:cation (Na+ or H+) symporter